MKNNDRNISGDWTKNWQGSIAIKITGAILWTIVSIGFIVALIFLQDIEDELNNKIARDADRLSYQVGNWLHDNPGFSKDFLKADLLKIQSKFKYFSTIAVIIDEKNYPVGDVPSEHISIKRNINFNFVNVDIDSFEVSLIIYHKPVSELAAVKRKETFILFGIPLVLFSLLLAWLIHGMVTKPIKELVRATQDVAKGKHDVRLKENRQDEFGILARFFNEMLDRLLSQTKEIELHRDQLEILVKERTEELAVARDEALEANKAKSTFLANMSHEFRTPLTAIIGYSEMLCEDINTLSKEEQAEDLKKIHSSGRHLLTLINDILDISKIEAGKMDIFYENCEMIPMAKDVMKTLYPLAEKNNNMLEFHYVTDLGAIETDVTKLRQTLYNLLSNACKFTENGRVTLEITKGSVLHTQWITFSVCDTGIGIPKKDLDKLFQPFSQADSSTTRLYGGTGLGLSISQYYTRLMEGEIIVDSVENKGSTFTIWLPQKTKTEEPESQNVIQVHQVLRHNTNMILIIDDNLLSCKTITQVLQKAGFCCKTLHSGKKALLSVKEIKPQVLILSSTVMYKEGWGLLNELKNDPDSVFIPMIIPVKVDEQLKGLSFGMIHCPAKVITTNPLLEVVKKYFEIFVDKKVLIIENSNCIINMIQNFFAQEESPILKAKDIIEIEEILNASQPKLILIDLMMPNFAQLIELISEYSQKKDMHIILLNTKDITPDTGKNLNNSLDFVLQNELYNKAELMDSLRENLDIVSNIKKVKIITPNYKTS